MILYPAAYIYLTTCILYALFYHLRKVHFFKATIISSFTPAIIGITIFIILWVNNKGSIYFKSVGNDNPTIIDNPILVTLYLFGGLLVVSLFVTLVVGGIVRFYRYARNKKT
jgi:hypothetical protein